MNEHKPNACCDFHRHIADGCCHCGDDPMTAEQQGSDESVTIRAMVKDAERNAGSAS